MRSDPQYILNDALAKLEKCEKDFSENKLVDMTTFETSIAEFCNLVVKLPPEQAKKYEKNLDALVKRLNVLSEDVKAKMSGLKGEINSVTKQMKAAKAYKKSSENNNNT